MLRSVRLSVIVCFIPYVAAQDAGLQLPSAASISFRCDIPCCLGIITLPPVTMQSIVIVCLFICSPVCPQAYLKNHMFQIN